ncbi:MAG TPA: hypothetical protein VEX41_10510 [Candidatus Eisenbacteria bacterium]|nr:hypothetical protein [Candidatus Eisenbacteria bacterium]
MDQLLRLDDVARLTGQPVERLRQWCATGELSCERVPKSWALRKADLPRVAIVAAEQERGVREHRAVALAVPRGRVPVDLVALVERTLGLPAGEVTIRGLAIDQLEYVVAVWPARARLGDPAALVALAERLDGELLTAGSMDGTSTAA